MTGLRIVSVVPGSLADELDIVAGDILVAVNGQPLRDVIDYSYRTSAEEELLLEVAKEDGDVWEIELEREPGESLGLIFAPPEPVRCANNCLFCFVHQLPKGLRKPLYVKDEDYRLSFLNGNYVTLANLKPAELARIVEQRLSPLYISVHATSPELREKLLGKKGLPPILDQLHTLAAARIIMHTQIVLCPGINDESELERTVADLAAMYPAVQSLAIVPLGLTSHRDRLPELTPVDSDYARSFLEKWQPEAERLRKKFRDPFLQLADEFYLKAGMEFPALKAYGAFPQLENGVGMVPLFLKEAAVVIKKARKMGSVRITVVTGKSAAGFVGSFLAELATITGIDIQLCPVENNLFGKQVTVTGLVSGRDIVTALAGREPGACICVPDVMLKEGEGLFLDDISLPQLESALGVPVVEFAATPAGFYTCLKSVSASSKKKVSSGV